MQLKESKISSKKSTLNNTHFNKTVKTIIPDDIITKIKYLCNIISEVEWSGILLYKVQGSIRDIDNMTITIKDIILMDKGSSARTGYSFNEKTRDQSGYTDRHIDYCEKNEDALEWNIGLIHSHQNFGVFFSAVDNEELQNNAPQHNCYLSIIVNNNTDIIGKLAYVAKASIKGKAQYKALDSNGVEFNLKPEDFCVTKNKLITIDCEIEANTEVDNFTFFEKNVFDVLKSKPVSTYGYNSLYNPSNYNNSDDWASRFSSTFEEYPKSFNNYTNQEFNKDEENHLFMDEIETLLCSLLVGFEAAKSINNLTDAIKKAYTEKRVPFNMLKNTILTDFKRITKQIYAINDEEFDMNVLSILQECIDYVDEYETTNIYVETVYLDILYETLQKLEETETKRIFSK